MLLHIARSHSLYLCLSLSRSLQHTFARSMEIQPETLKRFACARRTQVTLCVSALTLASSFPASNLYAHFLSSAAHAALHTFPLMNVYLLRQRARSRQNRFARLAIKGQITRGARARARAPMTIAARGFSTAAAFAAGFTNVLYAVHQRTCTHTHAHKTPSPSPKPPASVHTISHKSIRFHTSSRRVAPDESFRAVGRGAQRRRHFPLIARAVAPENAVPRHPATALG